jgi:hypothetical protein
VHSSKISLLKETKRDETTTITDRTERKATIIYEDEREKKMCRAFSIGRRTITHKKNNILSFFFFFFFFFNFCTGIVSVQWNERGGSEDK